MSRNHAWRQAILERDGYLCVCCPETEVISEDDLVAHHLESFDTNPELRSRLSNGITLCKFHHDEFHRRYGKNRITRREFLEFKKECLKGN